MVPLRHMSDVIFDVSCHIWCHVRERDGRSDYKTSHTIGAITRPDTSCHYAAICHRPLPAITTHVTEGVLNRCLLQVSCTISWRLPSFTEKAGRHCDICHSICRCICRSGSHCRCRSITDRCDSIATEVTALPNDTEWHRNDISSNHTTNLPD